MTDLATVLTPARTHCGLAGGSKKRLFETIAALISEDVADLTADEVYAGLLAREKLGSTALGGGIAIPHCRISSCRDATGALLTLSEPIDFDAPDRLGVDLLFVLLVPEEAHQAHLDILAGLARLLSNPGYCESLRTASNRDELFTAATTFQLD